MDKIEFIDLFASSSNETVNPTEILEAKIILEQLKLIFIVVPAILIAIGLPGNILTILVLHRKAMADEMVARYLISMCYFSMATLIFALPTFFNKATIGVEIPTTSEQLCQLYRYCSVTLVSITNWNLVIVTCVRYLETVVRSESLEDYYIRPCLTIFFMGFVCIAVQIPIMWNWISFERNGVVVECYLPSGSTMYHWEMTIQFIVPFFLLITPNLLIMLNTFKPPPVFDETETDPLLKVRKELYILVTISNVQFLVTVIPLMLYQYLKEMYDEQNLIDRLKVQMLLGVLLLFQYSNYATTIIFYVVFDNKFRTEFFIIVKACKKLCRRKKQVILEDIMKPSISRRVSRFSRASRSSRASEFSQSSKKDNQPNDNSQPEPSAVDGKASSLEPKLQLKRPLPKPTSDEYFFF